jgi:hypothetical protein
VEMNADKPPQWPADQKPTDVAIEFLREFRDTWAHLSDVEWAKLDSEEMAGERLWLTLKHVHSVVSSLNNLVAAVQHYISDRASLLGMSPELDLLMAVANDSQCNVSVTKALCEECMREEIDGKDRVNMRRHLKHSLYEMNSRVSSFDEAALRKTLANKQSRASDHISNCPK